jgi:S-adenosylmethionine hydrolase
MRAFALQERRYQLAHVSSTFHGRDIFAPAAAYLSLGVAPEAFGPELDGIVALAAMRAQRCPDGALEGSVVHIDRFGNIITDARAEDLPDGPLQVVIGDRTVGGPVRTYAEATDPAALVGSAGYLEVALKDGSAAAALAVAVGTPVSVRPLAAR